LIATSPSYFLFTFWLCGHLFWSCSVLLEAGKLAKVFRAQSSFFGRKRNFQSANMRLGTSYSRCLTVGANEAGIYLRIRFLFRIWHPPLFIPWEEISVRRKRLWLLGEFAVLTLGRQTQIPCMIRRSLAEELRMAAGALWPTEAGF
jgi:hypothetical protein